MRGDQDLVAVETGVVRDVVANVGEDGATHREVRRRFQLQQARQQATEAAGIQHEVRFDHVLLAVRRTHGHAWRLARFG